MGTAGKPVWLRKKFSPLGRIPTRQILGEANLHTVCEEACCPNLGECFSKGVATFLILGKTCTRNCHFCAVEHGCPDTPDPKEPQGVALAVKKMGLSYVVITSVTRDDLADGGASVFAQTIRSLQTVDQNIKIEVLIPDFKGQRDPLAEVLRANPTILGHNMETVSRLYPLVRLQADYQRSLDLIKESKKINPQIWVKSGIMLGLGETVDEVTDLLHDLKKNDCDFITIGQYLQPRLDLLPVARYVPPEEFEAYRLKGIEMGFKAVASGPFIRSSYNALELFETRNADQ